MSYTINDPYSSKIVQFRFIQDLQKEMKYKLSLSLSLSRARAHSKSKEW